MQGYSGQNITEIRSKEKIRAYKEFRKMSDEQLRQEHDSLEKQILYYENADSFVQSAGEANLLLSCVKRLDNLRDYVAECRQSLRL